MNLTDLTPEDKAALVNVISKHILPAVLMDDFMPDLRRYVDQVITEKMVKLAPDFTVNYCPHCGFRLRKED